MDKILQFFGLVTIKKARFIHNESFKLYARATAEFVEDDFGIPPNITLEADAARWSNECFDQIMNEYEPGVQLIGAWETEKLNVIR